MRADVDFESNDGKILISVSREELLLLAGSIRETLEAVEDWEFATLLGAEPAAALLLRDQIRDVLTQAHSPDELSQ